MNVLQAGRLNPYSSPHGSSPVLARMLAYSASSLPHASCARRGIIVQSGSVFFGIPMKRMLWISEVLPLGRKAE